MPFATAQNYRLASNVETAWGTPLTTGAKYLRITGANLKTAQSFTQSQEISAAHREVADVVATDVIGGGTLDGEFSYLTYEDQLSSLFGAAWTGTTVRVLKPGKVLRSLTLQEEYTDLTQFVSYPGAVITSWNLGVTRGQIITSAFGVSSKKGVPAGTTAIGTPAAANVNPVMDPVGSVQVLTEGGSPIAACATFSLSVTSDLITIPSLLLTDPAALYQGKFTVTGSFTFHKQDAAMLTKYINRTKTTLALRLGGASTKHVLFNMAQVTLTDGTPGGIQGSSPISETFAFQSTYDATDGSLKLTATD